VEPHWILIISEIYYYFYVAESIAEEVGIPRDVRLISSSTTSLTIGWIVIRLHANSLIYNTICRQGLNNSSITLFHMNILYRFLLLPAGQPTDVSRLDISPINNVMPKLGPISIHRLSMILMSKCPSL
jgi:hypothetical protein